MIHNIYDKRYEGKETHHAKNTEYGYGDNQSYNDCKYQE